MAKRHTKVIRIRSLHGENRAPLQIQVVDENKEMWHGRHQIQEVRWPPHPNYYIYRKTNWERVEE